MSFYKNFKSFYRSNILLFIILLFVIIYIIINWHNIMNSNYINGEYIKPILITGIFFLIFHMFITWDDDIIHSNIDANDVMDNIEALDNIDVYDIPKYKFNYKIDNIDNINNINNIEKINQPRQIINPFEIKHKESNFMENTQLKTNSNMSLNNKYKTVSKIPNNYTNNELLNKNINNNNTNDDINKNIKLNNHNIFITHKNSSKYGLKF